MDALRGSLGRHWPAAWDPLTGAALLLGFLVLYLPSYWTLGHTVWPTDEQGHGPIILAVSVWLAETSTPTSP